MDRRTLEQYLSQAEDHIDAARRRIELKARIVEHMKADRSYMVEEMLAQFKRSLESLTADRDLILSFIRSLR